VSLHPVAVILSVAAGSYLAGIPGALFSVPILAVANSSIRYIAGRTWEHDEVLETARHRDVMYRLSADHAATGAVRVPGEDPGPGDGSDRNDAPEGHAGHGTGT
jgi:hypothetical protein